jgi:hypothetical protein
VQADGKILVGGQFTTLGGGGTGTTTRNRIGRLNPEGTLDASFDPGANDAVIALAVQADGKILAGGFFTTLGGGGTGTTTRNFIGRLTNTDAAFQKLTADTNGTTVLWNRSSASPEVDRVTFQLSTDAINYSALTNPSRVTGGWQLTGLSLPTHQNIFIRARGFYSTGLSNGSGSIVETVRNEFLPHAFLCTSFSENFDSVIAPALPAGWVATNATGAAPLWVTQAANSDTAPNNAFIDDPDAVSDKRLDTPNIFIPSASAQVSFRNFYNLEGGGAVYYDGGVLEVSSPNINGGAFTDITNAAVGGSFVTGGYNGTIDTNFANPLAGRMAWSQDSRGYINTVVNLGPNVAGQTIKLRFRMGSDNSVGVVGWRIDNLAITTLDCPPTVLSAVSRKVHGGAGTFDINLPFVLLAGAVGIEDRTGGGAGGHQMVVTFANPVTVGGASVTAGTGSVGSASVNGAVVTINLTGVANAQRLGVTLSNVSDGANLGNVMVPMGVLLGDTTGNGGVNSSDISQTKGQSGTVASSGNFRTDVTVNGSINSSDISTVKSKSGTALPP